MMDKSLLMNLNGLWSNTACMGYCLIAMRRAGVNVKTQEKVLRELELSFDGVSIEDAEKAGMTQEGTDEREQAVPEFMGGIQSTRTHTWPGGKADRREPGHAEQQDEW